MWAWMTRYEDGSETPIRILLRRSKVASPLIADTKEAVEHFRALAEDHKQQTNLPIWLRHYHAHTDYEAGAS